MPSNSNIPWSPAKLCKNPVFENHYKWIRFWRLQKSSKMILKSMRQNNRGNEFIINDIMESCKEVLNRIFWKVRKKNSKIGDSGKFCKMALKPKVQSVVPNHFGIIKISKIPTKLVQKSNISENITKWVLDEAFQRTLQNGIEIKDFYQPSKMNPKPDNS